MADKKTATYSFDDSGDGCYLLEQGGDPLDTAETWILWIACMERLLQAKDLLTEKRILVKRVYSQVLGPVETIIRKTPRESLRIVTIYYHKDGKYSAVEFKADEAGPRRTGWSFTDTYDKVITAMRTAFGTLTKVDRDPTDAPDVLESWM